MIDARRSPELQAAILACKRVDADLRKAIYAATRQSVNALWLPALGRRAQSRGAQQVIVKGARAKVNTEGFSLMAATSRRNLSGGLTPTSQWQGFEFGATDKRKTFEQRSRLGRPYRVTKTVNRQFANRDKNGRIAYDAASEVGTKTVVAWVQAVVTTIVHATGGERS